MLSNRLTVAILAILTLMPAIFGRTVTDFFTYAPEDAVLLIKYRTRLDMLDYFHAGSETPSMDYFEGDTRIEAESPCCITVSNTKGASMQMAMLANQKDTVVAVINTVATPVEDSRIVFYNKYWKELKKQPAPTPKYSKWLTKEGRENIDFLTQILPFIMVKAEFDPQASTLTFTNNAKEQLVAEEYEKIKSYLISEIVYDIKGTNLKLRK